MRDLFYSQYGLACRPLSHTRDPGTSYDAADRMVKSGELSRQEQEILNVIVHYHNRFGGITFTAKEIASWTEDSPIWNYITYYTIQRRLSGLRNKGKIERISINNNGNPPWERRNGCCVWRLK